MLTIIIIVAAMSSSMTEGSSSSISPTTLTIMAFTLRNGNLGAAFTSSDHPRTIQIMETHAEQLGFPSVEHCKQGDPS